jgi:hypothetical protein
MSKGKEKAFDCDHQYRIELKDLRDDDGLLDVPKYRDKAKAVIRNYHRILSAGNLHPAGAKEIRRYLTTEHWVP